MVFGGTSGIGLACVELFAAGGGEVWAVSRNPQRAVAALSGLGAWATERLQI